MATDGPNDHVSLEVTEGVAHVRLEDPDNYNVFSLPLAEDLLTHLLAVDDREDVSAVALTAEGDAFCAGLDIDVLTGDDPGARERLLGYLDAVGSWLYTSEYPVVVGARGPAPGASALPPRDRGTGASPYRTGGAVTGVLRWPPSDGQH